MINDIKEILQEFDDLLISAENDEVDYFDGLEGAIESLFDECCTTLGHDDYTSIPGFDAYSDDEYINEEISKLYNLVLYLDSINNQSILQEIFNKLSALQSDLD
ncbi:TPA: hypothetical protein TXL33_000848 [Streptococcus suis]|uniref:hypothetical protein n=1 Tax=Streptococcus suis TaxID=1307 RepID=UPI001C945838|nr:hypothetical protein [Streptococcus suis]MBY5022703.1 hypothetical protein [Streptococcus suis]HEL1592412.1 hypothetical protein [Streptococcus suis]